MTAWIALFFAGVLEIVWAIGLKHSHGFTRLWPSVGTLAAIGLSFLCMAISLRDIPFGTAYAIWAGMGAAGTALLGILMFGESANVARMFCLAIIALGVVGLKLSSTS